jgi:hypothetical protein
MTLTTYDPEGIMLMWDIEITDQFARWWEDLSVKEQDSVNAAVDMLQGGT